LETSALKGFQGCCNACGSRIAGECGVSVDVDFMTGRIRCRRNLRRLPQEICQSRQQRLIHSR
jgi:hypothetical protein